jgi:outer membrane lipoprotein SlyB
MKPFLMVVPFIALTAACETQTPQERTLTGAAAGAALGAAIADDDDRVKGALLGGVAGAAAAQLIGPHTQQGQCVYRDAYGRQFVAPC